MTEITDAQRIDFIVRHIEHWYNVPNRTPIMHAERLEKQQCFLCVTPYKRQPDNPELRMLLLRVLDDSIRVERGDAPHGYVTVPLITSKGYLAFRVTTWMVTLSVPALALAWWLGYLS